MYSFFKGGEFFKYLKLPLRGNDRGGDLEKERMEEKERTFEHWNSGNNRLRTVTSHRFFLKRPEANI